MATPSPASAESQTVAEGDQFRIDLTSNRAAPGTATLTLCGKINEDVNFGNVFGSLAQALGSQPQKLELDLIQVEQINSCGIREWLLFIEKVQAKVPCTFTALSEVFIEQASIVLSLLGKKGTPVLSFEAPYFCSKCNERTVKVLSTATVKFDGQVFRAPQYACEKCKGALDFDALEEEYFNFLKYAKV